MFHMPGWVVRGWEQEDSACLWKGLPHLPATTTTPPLSSFLLLLPFPPALHLLCLPLPLHYLPSPPSPAFPFLCLPSSTYTSSLQPQYRLLLTCTSFPPPLTHSHVLPHHTCIYLFLFLLCACCTLLHASSFLQKEDPVTKTCIFSFLYIFCTHTPPPSLHLPLVLSLFDSLPHFGRKEGRKEVFVCWHTSPHACLSPLFAFIFSPACCLLTACWLYLFTSVFLFLSVPSFRRHAYKHLLTRLCLLFASSQWSFTHMYMPPLLLPYLPLFGEEETGTGRRRTACYLSLSCLLWHFTDSEEPGGGGRPLHAPLPWQAGRKEGCLPLCLPALEGKEGRKKEEEEDGDWVAVWLKEEPDWERRKAAFASTHLLFPPHTAHILPLSALLQWEVVEGRLPACSLMRSRHICLPSAWAGILERPLFTCLTSLLLCLITPFYHPLCFSLPLSLEDTACYSSSSWALHAGRRKREEGASLPSSCPAFILLPACLCCRICHRLTASCLGQWEKKRKGEEKEEEKERRRGGLPAAFCLPASPLLCLMAFFFLGRRTLACPHLYLCTHLT